MGQKLNYCFVFFTLISATLYGQLFPSQDWSGFDTFGCIDSNYVLVFSDEFNGTEIDTQKWFTKYPYDAPADRLTGGNQVFLDENVWLDNGFAYIRSKIESYTYMGETRPQTTGVIHSKLERRNKFQYGIFEMRAKVPIADGFWPAFWMYGWCANEIDIFELSNKDNVYRMDIHTQVPCGEDHERMPEKVKLPFNISDDFHTYKLIWTPFKLIWAIDDIPYRTTYKYYRRTLFGWRGVECSEIEVLGKKNVWKSQVFPFYDLDLIMSGGFGNATTGYGNLPIKPQEFPIDFIIDYIRVYQNIGIDEIAGQENLWSDQFYNFYLKGDLKVKNLKWECSKNLYLLEGSKNNILVGVSNSTTKEAWIKCTFMGKFGPIELKKSLNVLNSQSFARSAGGSKRIFRFPSFN